MSQYDDIRAALESNIANIVGVPDDKAWENTDFQPTTGTPWIRMTLSPGPRRALDITAEGTKRYDGLFFIDVFVPQDKTGPASLDDLVNAVIDAFDCGTILTANSQNVEIEYAEPSGSALETAPWRSQQVLVKWKAFN